MNVCRTCLKTPANKHISLLEKAINEDNKNFVDIMMFCLDITVTPNSNITTNLCNNCYRKIILFFKFKALSLKNDDYLKSLYPAVTLLDQEISVYVDENGIKHENSLDSDEFGPSLVEDSYIRVKEELDVKYEYTEDRQSHNELQSLEEENENIIGEIKDETKETAPVFKKRKQSKKIKGSKKIKASKVAKVKQVRQMCEECGKSVLNLKEHSGVHQLPSERQMLQCEACPKLFATFSGRKTHYRIKHLGQKFECNICHKKVVGLLAHTKRAHNPDSMRFVCVLCDRRYISQFALDVHMTSHTKVRAFECDVCHQKFGSKQRIIRHIQQVHQKVKLYQCHLCSKGFYRKDTFDDHIQTHSKERLYKCDDCGKSFATRNNLRKHRYIHVDVKTIHCQLCDKSFTRHDYLNAHMISHTKEKKHPCQFCGVRFGRSDHRRRHEYTAHQKHLGLKHENYKRKSLSSQSS